MANDPGDGDERPLGEELRLSQRLAALYAVTARLTRSASVDDVLSEVGRGVGQAIPRVGEVSIAVWGPAPRRHPRRARVPHVDEPARAAAAAGRAQRRRPARARRAARR